MAVTYKWEWLAGQKLTRKFVNGAAALPVTFCPVTLVSNLLLQASGAGMEMIGVALDKAAISETEVPIIISNDIFKVQVKSGVTLALGDPVALEIDGSVDTLGAAESIAGYVVDYTPATGGIAHIKAQFTALSGSGGGIGDVRTADIANNAVTYAKMQHVSATNRILGRKTASAGDVEEITVGGDLSQSGSNFTIAAGAVTGAKIATTADIAGTQISATADIAGTQLASDAAIAGTQLSASADIQGTQLSATADIAGTQLAAAAAIAGTQLAGAADIQGTQISATADLAGTQLASDAAILGSQLADSADIAGTQLASDAAIAGTQLSATADIAGTQLADAADIQGTQISATADLAGTQLSATADIAKAQLVTAVQTSLDNADTAATNIGTMASLITAATSDLVAAINELAGSLGLT